MSLEVTNLDYEMEPKKDQTQNETAKEEPKSSSQTTELELESGLVQFDPEEKELIFTPNEKDHPKFQIKIKEIQSLNESCLNKSILSFDYKKEENGKPYQIKIYNGKKDTISARSLKIVYESIFNEILEARKKEQKKFTDIIEQEPKPYQKELLEIAKKKNTIIFLETGLGKTYIGIMLIKEIFGEPLAANAKNEIAYTKKSNKKVLCLFQTISLLLQQSKVIKHNTNLRVIRLYSNSDRSAFANHSRFAKTMDRYDIICATPESIYRYFTFGYLNKDQFELILMDECHHCKGDHFYNRVLSHFIFDEGDNPKVKILGLTASPCEEGVLEKEQIRSKIIELCNNMNCHIACPKNIFDENKESVEERDNREPVVLEIDNPKENKNMDTIKEVKNYLFHSLIMPFLDFHFKNIFDNLTETYKQYNIIEEKTIKQKKYNTITDDGILIDSQNVNEDGEIIYKKGLTSEQKEINEKNKKRNKDIKDQKDLIRQEIAMYILNFYLTLFIEDEQRLDEKFLGLYFKNIDIPLLRSNSPSCYFNYFKNKKSKKKEYNYINESTIQGFIDRLSDQEEERVNFSYTMRTFIKRIQEDDILKKFKTYTKTINLIIKFLDKDALVEISQKFFDRNFLNDFKIAHLKEYNEDIDSKKEFLPTITKMLEPIQIVKNEKKFDFKSSHLNSLVEFLLNEMHKDDKTILFINQRIICEAFNTKLNKIFDDKEISDQYKSTYVIGISSNSDKLCPFHETQLKANIKNFHEDPTCKILCATNVIEEGIDIPDCNNVINLSDMHTIKEYIQKTGRARKQNSNLYLFSPKEEQQATKEKIKQIQISIAVMKQMLKENNFKPEIPKRKYIQNVNCFKTEEGAKAYYNYAPQIVNEFISKLYNDGYTYNRADMSIEKTDDGFFVPSLVLPSVLECSFQKIYDNNNNNNIKFDTKEKAEEYFKKYENFFYLKALILLHKNGYLNRYLQFTKNYDALMSFEEKFKKCEGEKIIEIKNEHSNAILDSENNYELIAYVLKPNPGYIDLTYNQEQKRYVVLLSESPLALLNFDLFLPTTMLLKLYYFGNDEAFNKDEKRDIWFNKKPKIPYTKYAKMNLSLDEATKIKIPKNKMDLINFFYVYTLFLSTDAEMYFYYCLYTKKFDFCSTLFQEEGLFDKMKYIFDHYDVNYLEIKHHLQNYQKAILNYHKHMIKYSFILYDEKKNTYSIDYKYINKCYNSVVRDIKEYNKFATLCFKEDEEREKLLNNEEYLNQETLKIEENYEDESGKLLVQTGMMVRSLFNFSKHMVMNYGQTTIKGNFECSSLKNIYKKPDYQHYYLHKYGVLTGNTHDYLKCTLLDYNMKLMKYKVNLSALGKVDKKWSTFRYIKKFHFFPGETLQQIEFLTIDQLYIFTLMPMVLFKLQNSLIYYYNSKCLLSEFKTSLGTLNKIDLKLVMQSMNAKSTLEIENYERLEFLGDAILKFLSSIELFNNAPNANRDLLFSLRRDIENNQVLFEKSTEKKLEDLLFTSPRTIKRMCIPGFTRDENVIFDISYNRSFTKNCYKHKIELKHKEKMTGNSLNFTADEKENASKNIEKENELDNEMRSDKMSIQVTYEGNPDVPEIPKELYVDQKTINDISDNQIILHPSNTYRFIYSKTLADIVESLTALTYLSSLANYGDDQFDKAYNLATLFLNEMGLLKNTYMDIINSITNVAVNNVEVNPNCRFNDESKDNYLQLVLKNKYYTFKNKKLAYQAMNHPASLEEANVKKNNNYVNKSYQRLAFLGEAIVELYVSLFVYRNNPYETESNLHKMRICGINHHIISLIACDLKFNDCLLSPSGGGFKTDINKYQGRLLVIRNNASNKYKLPLEELDNEEFVIILCELFHAYIGAIFADCHDIKTTFDVLDQIMLNYLNNNATKDTYTEHPKETILNEYMRRRHYIKSLKENGGNRIVLKFEKERGPYRKRKMYTYQLIIDNFIIYEENILYSRPCIKVAQEKAKNVFLRVCDEIDRRIKLKMSESNSHFGIKNILDYLGINYQEYHQ